jgi:hypothetical protein
MKMRKKAAAMLMSWAVTVGLIAYWFVLNQYRVKFYESSVKSSTTENSPFWKIVEIQEVVGWLILVFAILSIGLAILGVVRVVSARDRK